MDLRPLIIKLNLQQEPILKQFAVTAVLQYKMWFMQLCFSLISIRTEGLFAS